MAGFGFCPFCGYPNRVTAKVCDECKESINKEPNPTPVSAPPSQGWRSRLKVWWKQFVKNHIVDDYPYDDEM